MDGGGFRVEAQRWLTISEKLLAARDLSGAKSFAIRARDSDPRLQELADQIIAVSDTIAASDVRVNGNSYDYYTILQLGRLTHSLDLVAGQYRKLAVLLNPNHNRLPFADQAFRLVSEAWSVLADPSKKALYDHELQMSQFVQLGQLGQLGQVNPNRQTQQFELFGQPGGEVLGFQPWGDGAQSSGRKSSPRGGGVNMSEPVVGPGAVEGESSGPIRPVTQWKTPPPKPHQQPAWPVGQQQQHFTVTAPSNSTAGSRSATTSANVPRPVDPSPRPVAAAAQPPPSAGGEVRSGAVEPDVPGFWTACPYCLNMYQYAKEYEDCAIRCQNCKRSFQGVAVPDPPMAGKDSYFCCWGFFPLAGKVSGGRASGGWTPFSAMFATPMQAGGKAASFARPKTLYKDDLFMDLSGTSGDDDDGDSDDDWRRTSKKARGGRSGGGSGTGSGSGTGTGRGSGRGRGRPRGSGSGRGRPRGSGRGRGRPRGSGSAGASHSMSVEQQSDNEGIVDTRANGQEAAGVVFAMTGKKGEGSGSVKRKGARDLGRLDLNVMFSNEGEEAVPGVSERNKTRVVGGGGEEPIEGNIEGIGTGFFEGLDEFLSSLPILSGVGDDKVKAA